LRYSEYLYLFKFPQSVPEKQVEPTLQITQEDPSPAVNPEDTIFGLVVKLLVCIFFVIFGSLLL